MLQLVYLYKHKLVFFPTNKVIFKDLLVENLVWYAVCP